MSQAQSESLEQEPERDESFVEVTRLLQQEKGYPALVRWGGGRKPALRVSVFDQRPDLLDFPAAGAWRARAIREGA